MSTLFVVLYLAAFVATIVFFLKWRKQKKSGADGAQAKKLTLISLCTFLVFFILTGITAPKTEKSETKDPIQTSSTDATTQEVKEEPKTESVVVESIAETIAETAVTTESETTAAVDSEALRDEFNAKLGETKPTFSKSVRNDKTGNWRELICYSDKAIDGDLAIEYYKAYFESDQEVHFIVNLFLKTTTRINKFENTLSVTCKEYKDKEEHDANELGGGEVLDEFVVNIDTGEVTK